MIFEPLELGDVYLIKPEKYEDDRGFFARSFCKNEFQQHDLVNEFVQCNISYNKKKGTLRGMHFQIAPYEETKLVRCSQGTIYDVLVDIRQGSDQYLQWHGIELSSKNGWTLYIPSGFAHGFMTLSDNTTVFYQMSEFYQPNCSAGFCWKDPEVAINWPFATPILSDRDAGLPFVHTLIDED